MEVLHQGWAFQEAALGAVLHTVFDFYVEQVSSSSHDLQALGAVLHTVFDFLCRTGSAPHVYVSV
jgi:hypothetical protein